MASNRQGGWQFVNISEPKRQKKDEAIRKIVRANAMRDYRKKQREERQPAIQADRKPRANEGRPVRHFPGTEKPEESTVVSQCSVSEALDDRPWQDLAYVIGTAQLQQLLRDLDSMSLAEITIESEDELAKQSHDPRPEGGLPFWQGAKFSVNPKTLLDSGTDPFSALPVFGNPRYTALVVHHFATVVANNCLPLDSDTSQNPMVNIWLPFSMYDPALFFSTLGYAAVHIDILTGRKTHLQLLSYKNDTIRNINEKLQSPEDALTDSAIGSVAMLAATESIQGNYSEMRIHMDALKRMVQLRGGLQKLSAVVHMFVSWQDLLFSAVLAQPPIYTMVPCCVELPDNLALESQDSPVFPVLGVEPVVSKQFVSLFADLRNLTDTVNQQNTWNGHANLTTAELMTFSKSRTALEHRIVNMARSLTEKPRAVMTQDDYTLELCRLAALVYIKLGLHMFLPFCSILRTLKGQVMQLIRDGEKYCFIGITSSTAPECMTWALLMCSLLAMTSEEEDFFAKRIAKGTRGRTWSDMEALLKRIAWVDKLRAPACRRVWARVDKLNAEDFQRQGLVDAPTQWLGGAYS